MANVISAKFFKINPENQATAEGTVVKCKYIGSASAGFGPLGKTSHYYKAIIQVEGLEKPLVLKVKEKENLGPSFSDITSLLRSTGKFKPINEGEKVMVTYDVLKPKKCNIAE